MHLVTQRKEDDLFGCLLFRVYGSRIVKYNSSVNCWRRRFCRRILYFCHRQKCKRLPYPAFSRRRESKRTALRRAQKTVRWTIFYRRSHRSIRHFCQQQKCGRLPFLFSFKLSAGSPDKAQLLKHQLHEQHIAGSACNDAEQGILFPKVQRYGHRACNELGQTVRRVGD